MSANKLSSLFGQTLGWPVFLWMAIAGLLATSLLAIDSARLVGWAARSALRRETSEADLSRRAFMRRVSGGGAALSAIGLSFQGAYQALKVPSYVEIPITLARLPKSMDGFVIAQITDLHVGNTIGEAFVSGVVEAVNAMKADLIVITGDLVDGTVHSLREHVAPLAQLSSKHGVFFVTGNHEYYAGADSWIAHLQELGIRVLRNERVSIGSEQASFDLAGIDDHGSARWPGHGPDLAQATAGRDPERELVVLAHQPRQVHVAKEHRVGLQLSGHTHGGQIWPWHYLAKAQQGGLLAGHSWHKQTQLYVSRGTGYWGPPVRVFAKSEITRVILRRA